VSDGGATARLFVAVDLPAEVRRALTAWARLAARGARSSEPAASAPLRVLDAELLHVTICFLGERPLQEVDSIAQELAACERASAHVSLGAPLWLPPRHPRALAVELHDDDGALAETHAQVTRKLQPGEPRRHRFRPHVTVARMRHGDAPRERSLPPTPAHTFAPSELVLYRSWLSPQGASYEALSAFALG